MKKCRRPSCVSGYEKTCEEEYERMERERERERETGLKALRAATPSFNHPSPFNHPPPPTHSPTYSLRPSLSTWLRVCVYSSKFKLGKYALSINTIELMNRLT